MSVLTLASGFVVIAEHLPDNVEDFVTNPSLVLGALALFVDLDGFKAVNDTLGHLAGDTLLVSVARASASPAVEMGPPCRAI